MSNILVAQNMRFMFCCGAKETAKLCCCGCSLRLGTQIICVLMVISSLMSLIYSQALSSYISGLGTYYIIYPIIYLVTYIMIFIGTFGNNFKICYFGNIFLQILQILQIIAGIIFGIILGSILDTSNVICDDYGRCYTVYLGPAILVVYVIYILISTALTLYFNYIIFSYTKQIGLGNIALIEGQFVTNINQVNIQPNNGYIPPQNSNDALRPNQVYYQPGMNNTNPPMMNNTNPPMMNNTNPSMMTNTNPPMINTPYNNMNNQTSFQPIQNYQVPSQEYNINSFTTNNLPNYFTLNDPNDLAFAQISQNALVSDSILPSGFKVPSSRDGKNWRIAGNMIVLI